jgi:dehydrogenase/reductase SDR family protein 7B
VVNVQPGYINTNVSINALTSDGNKNSQNDDDHRNGFEPNYVARRMIYAILRGDKEVLVAVLLHRLAIWLRFFTPNLFFWAMKLRAKKTYDKKFQ